MRTIIQDKFEHAYGIRDQIVALCLEQCESPQDRTLLRIATLLEDFTNNLRATLNYTLNGFCTSRLQPVLAPSSYARIERCADFPWADSKGVFDRKPLVTHIRIHFGPVYAFLEGLQSYHPGNGWLRHMMLISNRGKHIVTNEVLAWNAVKGIALKPDGTSHPLPMLCGDKMLIADSEKPRIFQLPCYYRPLGMFASKDGHWVLFFVVIGEERLGLNKYLELIPPKIEQIISDFSALL